MTSVDVVFLDNAAVHVGPSGDWAMAITDKGQVYAWGEGTDFRTGLGNTARASFPKNVEFPSPVKRLALGHSHGIAVTQDYGVFTWYEKKHGLMMVNINQGCRQGFGNCRQNNHRTIPQKNAQLRVPWCM